jgi:hypothetical protein
MDLDNNKIICEWILHRTRLSAKASEIFRSSPLSLTTDHTPELDHAAYNSVVRTRQKLRWREKTQKKVQQNKSI